MSISFKHKLRRKWWQFWKPKVTDVTDIWQLEEWDEACTCPPDCRHLEIDNEDKEYCMCTCVPAHTTWARTPILYKRNDKTVVYYGSQIEENGDVTVLGKTLEKP